MANDFQSGAEILFLHRVSGSTVDVALGIRAHSIDLTVVTHDVSTNRSGGGTTRIAGKTDSMGTVSASLDLDEMPHAGDFLIYPGQTGVMNFGVSNEKSVRVPFIVKKLHYEASVESEVRWTFDIEENVVVASGSETGAAVVLPGHEPTPG